jgi:hypothetical protein
MDFLVGATLRGGLLEASRKYIGVLAELPDRRVQ